MRRYSADDVLLLAFHDGREPTACIADSTWERNYAWYSSPWGGNKLQFGREGIGAVIGKRSIVDGGGDTLTGPMFVNGRRTPGNIHGTVAQVFENITRIDSVLQAPPEALVDLTVGRYGDSVDILVSVDSIVGTGRRLALRVNLFEDTVMLVGGTIRRMQLNVVRASLHSPGLPLGAPIPGDRPSTNHHAFNLSRLQALQDSMATDPAWVAKFSMAAEDITEEYLKLVKAEQAFPNPREWVIDRRRLYVVAFVQDLDTGDVLQGAMVKLPDSGTVNVTR